jgi:hypothetical protein
MGPAHFLVLRFACLWGAVYVLWLVKERLPVQSYFTTRIDRASKIENIYFSANGCPRNAVVTEERRVRPQRGRWLGYSENIALRYSIILDACRGYSLRGP